MKVVKFGGTSLSSACNFLRCKDIALAETDRKIIVVSAPGKRFKTDSKVTDLLFLATCYHQYGFDFTPVIKRVKKRFKEIVCGLDLAIDVDSEFDLYISSYLKDGNAHYLVSRGEYLASKIFAQLIGARFIDAKDLFIMDRLGQVDEREALTRLEDLKIDKRVVVGGFYGGYRGKVRLFERGGGDISGAYLAKLLHADAYEIFSDVNGIMPINPDFVKTPNHVRKLTYREMELLDHLKAKVVNQRAVGVLSGSGVRLYIKNTFNPSCDGTEIFDGTVVENKITAIGCDGGYACVNLDGAGLKPNTIKGLNDCLSALKIQPEVIFFADDGISVMFKENERFNTICALNEGLKEIGFNSGVKAYCDLAVISIVGAGVGNSPEILPKAFKVFQKNGVTPTGVFISADGLKLSVYIEQKYAPNLVKGLYKALLK